MKKSECQDKLWFGGKLQLRQDCKLQVAYTFYRIKKLFLADTELYTPMNVFVHPVRDHICDKPSWKSSNILLMGKLQSEFTTALANWKDLGKPKVNICTISQLYKKN